MKAGDFVNYNMSLLKRNSINFFKYFFLGIFSLLTFFPLWWTFVNSFRTNDQIFSSTRLIPESFTYLKNYVNIFAQNVPLGMYNSATLTVVSLALLLVCAIPAAYLMSQYKFKSANLLFGLFTMGIVVPRLSILIATFSNFSVLGFLHLKYPITLCYATFELPIAIFLLVGFMQTIPTAIVESAKIDGCNSFGLLMKIVLPISRNGVVTVLILAFVSIWNEYAYAMVLIPNIMFKTITVVLASAKSEYATEYGMMSAGVMVAVIPMIVVYSFLQDKIISGMVAGAVKG